MLCRAIPEVSTVGRSTITGTINDPANRTSHEVDIVAFGLDDDGRAPLIALGEATWDETMGMGHLERLRRIRALLTAQGRHGAAQARLVCFSGAGFTDELAVTAAQHNSIILLGPAALYQPSE